MRVYEWSLTSVDGLNVVISDIGHHKKLSDFNDRWTVTFGEFLRAQRARITREEAALRGVGNPRISGLRREEVAVLAGVSADCYARFERGRERARLCVPPRPTCTYHLCDHE